jgi:Tfp pilus assembly protein FimV
MARTRVRWGRVGGLLAAAGVALTLAASSAQAGDGDPAPGHRVVHHTRHYVVRPGDTLWAIAARLSGPDADPRGVLDSLVRANHLGATLPVGTRLVIPS